LCVLRRFRAVEHTFASNERGISVSLTVSQRALMYLYYHAGHDGVSCFDVGGAVWPDRAIRGGRGVSVNGGGDYAAQMLLGRLKKARLVEQARSEGSTRWRLSTDGRREGRRCGFSVDVDGHCLRCGLLPEAGAECPPAFLAPGARP
jgi:hypothetical protein